MKIGIDLDEVVFEFFKKYLEIFNKKFNTNVSLSDLNKFHIWEVTSISKEDSLQLANEFYNSESFNELELVEGVKEAISFLNKNYEIYFITSRPESIKEKTNLFLKNIFKEMNYQIYFSGGVWGGNKSKGQICAELGIDFFVEDNLDYALSCAKRGIFTFLLDKPWNKEGKPHEKIFRVKNWKEILNKLIYLKEIKNEY